MYSAGISSKMATIAGSPCRQALGDELRGEYRLARSGRSGHEQAVAFGDAAAQQRIKFADAGGKTPSALDLT